MSDVYIGRLPGVQAEFDAARQAPAYVERHWQGQAIYREVGCTTPRDLAAASRHVEATYIIRLFAEFEGVLQGHLTINHPEVVVPIRPKVDWLIKRLISVERLDVSPQLRRKLDAVRDYRNSIAHRQRQGEAVALTAALSVLNTFAARLPDPVR